MTESTVIVKLQNLDTAAESDKGGALVLPVVPTELTLTVAVEWARANVQGMSHQVLEYSHTENHKLPLELVVSRAIVDPLLAASDANMLYPVRFLLAATVPGRTPSGEVMDRPPELLLIWPHLMTVRLVLTAVSFGFQEFTNELGPWAYVASCEFERVRDARVLSEDYLARGFDA